MFINKSPFYHIYVTVSHNMTHSTEADMLNHMFYLDKPFSPNQLTTLWFHMQIPILIIMAYVKETNRKKRPMNLVLISHKYSKRNTNLGITFCYRCENLFSLKSEGYEIKRCLRNYDFSQKLRKTC